MRPPIFENPWAYTGSERRTYSRSHFIAGSVYRAGFWERIYHRLFSR